jgi:hypothetical protein
MRATPANARRVSPFPGAIAALLLIAASILAQGEIRLQLTGANNNDEFGSGMNTAGDVNADGYADVIVGAPLDLPASGHRGTAKIFSGIDGSVLLAISGTAPNQYLGLGVAPVSDVDGDGVPDVIVGLSGNGSTGMGPGGGARIISGATGAILRTFAGTVVNDGFGQTCDGLGDVNGDGVPDVVVGTSFPPSAAQPGYAKVYSGATGAIIYTKTGTFNGQRFGLSYSAGDVNGDGVVDFMIGAIGNNVNGASSGSINVYSGASGTLVFSAHGTSASNLLGYSGHGLGDLDGDGFGDVIAGTFMPSGAGYARVYSGANGGILFHMTDGVTGDTFGHTVGGTGDVNGDGVKDFAIAAPDSNVGGTSCGRVTVFSGANGSVLREFIGPAAGTRLGYALRGAGDVNGDGLQDVAIGSLVTSASNIPGKAEVVSICAGQPFGATGLPNQTLTLQWTPGAPATASQGLVSVSGAAASSTGILAASLGSGSATYLDVPVFLDISPGFLTLLNVAYDENGEVAFPINLRDPYLAGVTYYAQSFEADVTASQGWRASGGLMLLFGL